MTNIASPSHLLVLVLVLLVLGVSVSALDGFSSPAQFPGSRFLIETESPKKSFVAARRARIEDHAPLSLKGGAPFDRKTFTASTCLRDHIDIMKAIPGIYDAYAGPNRLDPKTIEAIMLAVNSVNSCPYCTGLHCELGRMAGLKDDTKRINEAKTSKELQKVTNDKMVNFARKFGEYNGRGACFEAEYQELVKSVGKGKANAIKSLCWFLHWGSISGNTLLSFYRGRLSGNPKKGSNLIFEILFALYYTPLYLLITATTCILKVFPANVPRVLSMSMGCVLATIASLKIVPMGILGVVTSPFRKKQA
ncbi:hypothetical protein GUITHDRAFT_165415 [Guillardia theta CCMP2712]|uniref:Carboxymuconolactone decarboxylase-like domain-containing protein n=2 Tax=Guillardia theta TaxID=55529 RepID=L1IP71_GUITC|nr:hypothetical protein GUITHDRAFT_165415 [Guillardia theta CCMP2712]EKX37684.1 hypothetical protein GUITHDRAFT_165415 [Guillardia theta CCMP2712]|eukprot:XP_005824664.1 hypothetical protein GUITHDRAFT_165415 [Guillardia theta CCMP2712]